MFFSALFHLNSIDVPGLNSFWFLYLYFIFFIYFIFYWVLENWILFIWILDLLLDRFYYSDLLNLLMRATLLSDLQSNLAIIIA